MDATSSQSFYLVDSVGLPTSATARLCTSARSRCNFAAASRTSVTAVVVLVEQTLQEAFDLLATGWATLLWASWLATASWFDDFATASWLDARVATVVLVEQA